MRLTFIVSRVMTIATVIVFIILNNHHAEEFLNATQLWKGSQDVILLVLMPQNAKKKFRARMVPPLTLQMAHGTGQLDRCRTEVQNQGRVSIVTWLRMTSSSARGDIPTAVATSHPQAYFDQPSTDNMKVIHCLP